MLESVALKGITMKTGFDRVESEMIFTKYYKIHIFLIGQNPCFIRI